VQDRSRLTRRIPLGAAAAGVALVSVLNPALAWADARSGAGSFCKTARDLAESYERIDETDPDESLADLEEAERAYRRLRDEAPATLRASFRRILVFFPILKDASTGELDIDDRKEGGRYVDAASKAAKGFNKVFDYLDDKCNVDID
jgi:hypothetical protein